MTVAAFVWGFGAEERCVINFLTSEKTRQEKAEQVGLLLDEADIITAFNGVRFDTPFLHKVLHFDARRVEAWQRKTFDILEQSRETLNLTFKLSELLLYNGLQAKSGSGLQAIEWAKDPNMWPMLEEYCTDDACLTFHLASQRKILLPPFTEGSNRQRNLSVPFEQWAMLDDEARERYDTASLKPCCMFEKGKNLVIKLRVKRTLENWAPRLASAPSKRLRFGAVKG